MNTMVAVGKDHPNPVPLEKLKDTRVLATCVGMHNDQVEILE